MQVDLTIIEQKKKELDEAKRLLKAHFIGIDEVIDDLLDYIQIWYLMPEILNRPIIINLWGMTGVGKTDLVRRLVKHLNFQDRFAEVELSNVDSTSWVSSIASVLDNNGINDEKPSIVLFDEIQRFNTIDSSGDALQQTKFMDFWELLSDGKLSKKEKDDLDYYLNNFLYRNKDIQKRKLKGETEIEENPNLSYYEIQNFKRLLGLEKEVHELSDLTEKDVFDLLVQEKKKKTIYEPVDHAKTLIIISGNLDEAFDMAKQISESDIDADIFHSYTQKVTIVDVKNALNKKFRPEQVARFGNIHLIYKSLRKTDFETLIQREIERIISTTNEKFGVTLSVSPEINQLIYRNGVFPVQGVRPVFSSVIDILESNLSKFLFTALMSHEKNIDIQYITEPSEIIAKIGEQEMKIPYVGRIDKIRESNLQDTVANISVHEAGHAVVYMLLMGMPPLQLKSKVASSYAAGFTFPHQVHETKGHLINKAKVYLAGGLAEEMIFGANNASIGRVHDREQATIIVGDFIRRLGFDEEFQATYTMEYGYAMNKYNTDDDVEKMMVRLVNDTKQLLYENKPFLKDLSIELCQKGSLNAEEMAEVATKHKINVLVREEGHLHIHEYHKDLQG